MITNIDEFSKPDDLMHLARKVPNHETPDTENIIISKQIVGNLTQNMNKMYSCWQIQY